jgi:hypothetical protein
VFLVPQVTIKCLCCIEECFLKHKTSTVCDNCIAGHRLTTGQLCSESITWFSGLPRSSSPSVSSRLATQLLSLLYSLPRCQFLMRPFRSRKSPKGSVGFVVGRPALL